ncbi:MAG: type VI secretion system ATPase TssH, partial [Thermoleophilaceae bacterium]
IIMFRPLSRDDLVRIVELQLVKVERLLADRRLKLEIGPEAKQLLIAEGYDPVYGARPLKRVIQREIQNPLALAILEGDYSDGDTIRVVRSSDGKRLEFLRIPAGGGASEPLVHV